MQNIPDYSGNPYVVIDNNKPSFTENDYTTNAFETYSDLDKRKRCGVAYANICKEIMPLETDDRESLYSVIPSGWQQAIYEGIVEGDYLYNRCHLIGHQLAGENVNNHVLYRVTPIFDGDNLVASGVQMEAYSVEDNGKGICFNVYVYNVQPGIIIDYATGESRLAE